MASDFWSRQLGVPANEPQRPAQAPQRAWWQEPDPYQQAQQQRQELAPGYQPQPTNYGGLQQQMPYGGPTAGAGVPEAQYIQQLKATPASQLSGEQMEQIAEFELRTKQNHNSSCPQCGSSNYLPAGMRVGGVIMPTEKCFNCGLSARGPEPAIGGRGGGGASSSARQIDTGGGAGSMYLKFRGVPASYMPKGG